MYQNKYLKYKNKYLKLKQQLGGLFTEEVIKKTATQKFDELVASGDLGKNKISINATDFGLISEFFNKLIKTKESSLLPVDEIGDYVGKLNMEDSDLNNLGFRFNRIPRNDLTVNIIKPTYKYTNTGPNLNTSINYNSTKNIITLKGTTQLQLPSPSKNILENLKKITDNIKENKDVKDQDQVQFSGNFGNNEWIRTNLNLDKINTSLLHFGKSEGTDLLRYYPESNLFIILDKEEELVNYRIFHVKRSKDDYKIFPHSYSDPILNDKYSPPIKGLFTSITTRLKEIIPGINYLNFPDRFFHIHVTPINNESYILLTLHVLYEIESNVGPVNFTHNGNTINRIASVNTFERDKTILIRKQHSFYLLFNLNENEHYIYNALELSNKDEYFLSNIAIGIKENIFGDNILDINYIGGTDNVLLSKVIKKCELFCE